MVRVTKQTNIFNLITNKFSTVDDFKRLYVLAPEKFQLIYDEMNIYEYADLYERNDLLPYLKGVISPLLSDKILHLLSEDPYKLRDFLEDKDLRTLTKEEQESIITRLFNNTDRMDNYHKLIMLLDKGIDVNTKTSDDTPILYLMLAGNNYEAVKFLVEKGANVNEIVDGVGYLWYVYNRIPITVRDRYYKLFLEHSINPDQVIDQRNNNTLLISAIVNKYKELFDLLLEKGANVNIAILPRNTTPLSIALLTKDIYYVRKLIENRADVNQLVNNPPQPLLLDAIFLKQPIDIIKLILDSGANKDITFKHENGKESTALQYTLRRYKYETYESDKDYFGKVIELLGGKIPGKELWKGFSRSDIEKFDIFFEKPYDWSTCPVCLEYIERSSGCMYMSHDCATTGHYYHKKLYAKFMYTYGKNKVEWCTICGRITENHTHFKLSQAQEGSKELAPLNPEIQARLNNGDNIPFFDNANCVGFGGGGTEEKAARFRRLREYGLDLQEDVGKKLETEVMDELIEEVWNAPLIRNKKIKTILADKRWNIPVSAFPANVRPAPVNAAPSPVRPNIPFIGAKPTIVAEGDCIIYADDDEGEPTNPVYEFYHATVGGMDHDGIYICQKDLAKAIQIKNAEFGLEGFGKCWFSDCKGILHPEEIRGLIPDVLFEEYRKKFNNKMAQQGGGRKKSKTHKRKYMSKYRNKTRKHRGGNNNMSTKSLLFPLENGECTPHNLKRNGTPRKFN